MALHLCSSQSHFFMTDSKVPFRLYPKVQAVVQYSEIDEVYIFTVQITSLQVTSSKI